jgi:hypothetical protein
LVEISIREPRSCCQYLQTVCIGGKLKSSLPIKQLGELAFDGYDYFPEEFMPKVQNEFTMEEEGLYNTLNKSGKPPIRRHKNGKAKIRRDLQ